MIRYTKEEFPARFTVFEHKCEYCGITFFSNRAKTKYDTGTCRTYDNTRKRAKKSGELLNIKSTETSKIENYDYPAKAVEKYYSEKSDVANEIIGALGLETPREKVDKFIELVTHSRKTQRIYDENNIRFSDVSLNHSNGVYTVSSPYNQYYTRNLSLK